MLNTSSDSFDSDEKQVPLYFPPVIYTQPIKMLLCQAIAPVVKRVTSKKVSEDIFRPLRCTPQNLARSNTPIASIDIPRSWKQIGGDEDGEFLFWIDNKQDVLFEIKWNGFQILDTDSHALKSVTSKPFHDLTTLEWAKVDDCARLGKKEPAWAMEVARSKDWSGRPVLESEGKWLTEEKYSHAAETHQYCLDVDVYGSDGAHLAIFYQAPEKDYAKYLPEAKKCMESIRWKKVFPTSQ